MNQSKSLIYYHNKVKNDPDKMNRRREYYKQYYQDNKKPSTKKIKLLGIKIEYGSFIINFD